MAADLDRRAARLGLGPVLWLLTVFGVYVTVPDTELIRPLVGVAIPLALCGWPLRVARVGAGGAAAGIALLMWVGAAEGYGRPGSIVGAAAALGLFLVEPAGRSAAPPPGGAVVARAVDPHVRPRVRRGALPARRVRHARRRLPGRRRPRVPALAPGARGRRRARRSARPLQARPARRRRRTRSPRPRGPDRRRSSAQTRAASRNPARAARTTSASAVSSVMPSATAGGAWVAARPSPVSTTCTPTPTSVDCPTVLPRSTSWS